MPPSRASQTVSQIMSIMMTHVVLLIACSLIGLLAARYSGAKSRKAPRYIFSLVALSLWGFTYSLFLRTR